MSDQEKNKDNQNTNDQGQETSSDLTDQESQSEERFQLTNPRELLEYINT